MKFFTPDLLARFGSLDDQVANAAQEEWEQAAATYREHLAGLRGLVPRFDELRDATSLHDAKIVRLGPSAGWMLIEIIPPGKAGRPVLLAYLLCHHGTLIPESFGPPEGSPDTLGLEQPTNEFWMYDEVDRPDQEERGWGAILVHTVLLSDGREMRIPFRDFQWVYLPAKERIATLPSTTP